jgi:hypothetical protein
MDISEWINALGVVSDAEPKWPQPRDNGRSINSAGERSHGVDRLWVAADGATSVAHQPVSTLSYGVLPADKYLVGRVAPVSALCTSATIREGGHP